MTDAGEAAARSRQISRQINEPFLVAFSSYFLGYAHCRQKDFERAQPLGEEALGITQATGNIWMAAAASGLLLADIAIETKKYEDARRHVEQGLRYFREIVQPWGISQCIARLGFLAQSAQNYAATEDYLKQSLGIYRESGFTPDSILLGVLNIVGLFTERLPDTRAVELLSLVVHHPKTQENMLEQAEQSRVKLAAAVPSDVFAAAWERGKTLDLDEVVEELLSGAGGDSQAKSNSV